MKVRELIADQELMLERWSICYQDGVTAGDPWGTAAGWNALRMLRSCRPGRARSPARFDRARRREAGGRPGRSGPGRWPEPGSEAPTPAGRYEGGGSRGALETTIPLPRPGAEGPRIPGKRGWKEALHHAAVAATAPPGSRVPGVVEASAPPRKPDAERRTGPALCCPELARGPAGQPARVGKPRAPAEWRSPVGTWGRPKSLTPLESGNHSTRFFQARPEFSPEKQLRVIVATGEERRVIYMGGGGGVGGPGRNPCRKEISHHHQNRILRSPEVLRLEISL